MNCFTKTKLNALAMLFVALAALAIYNSTAFAHGGEDHGEQPAPVVSAGAGMVTHVARAGDLEIAIKHAPLEPDKETTARVFVTRFASNEPVGGAKIVVILTGASGVPVEAVATTTTPGIYEAKLPPLPKGQYKLAARLENDKGNNAVEYGALQISPPPATPAVSGTSWARNLLIALAVLVGLGLSVAIIYRVARHGARQNRDHVKGQTAAA